MSRSFSFSWCFSLFLGEFQGSHQPPKTGTLRNDGEVDQFQSAAKNDRQKGATQQGKGARAAHGDPVVLQMEGLFYIVDVFLRSLGHGADRLLRGMPWKSAGAI